MEVLHLLETSYQFLNYNIISKNFLEHIFLTLFTSVTKLTSTKNVTGVPLPTS